MIAAPLDRSITTVRALREFRRGERRRRSPRLYHLYVLLVLGGIGGSLTEHALATLIGPGLTAHQLTVGGPAALLVLTVLAVRFGSWHGPVGFSKPDIALLLTAPIAIAALVRPKLDHALIVSAVAGAVAGAVIVLMVHGGPAGLGAGRVAGAVVSMACFTAAVVAASWLVESSRRLALRIRRAGPVPLLVAVGLAALGWLFGHTAGVWLGPWGWTLAPLVGTKAWPLATLLLAGCTALLVTAAHRRAGRADAETFAAHADVRSGLGASAFTLDYRGAALTYRAAASSRTHAGLLRRPLPRGRRLVFVTRDVITLGYEPSRLVWAALLAVGATLEALTHPGRVVPALIAAASVYAAATLLSEPARVDVDSPDRLQVLTPWRYAHVLVEHCVLPAASLLIVAGLTIVGAVAGGIAQPAALALIPALLVPAVAIAALAAVLTARRGGRVSETLLTRILANDPSNPGGAALIAVWLAPFLGAALLAIGLPVALVGHALRHHAGAFAAAAGSCAFMAVAAGWLLVVALGTRPPD